MCLTLAIERMKISIRTLQQKVFTVDVEPSSTIASVKNTIEKEQGHPVSSQKLIYSGRILVDENTVESYSVKENDFFVLMVTKVHDVLVY